MHNYFQHIQLFLKRFVWLIILYFLSRLFFYLLNIQYFSGISFVILLKSFLAGLRFDIAAIAFTNIIFLIFLFPSSYKNNRIVLKTSEILFFTINAIAILSNFIDARFFDFINKRSTSAIFSLMGANEDVWLLLPRFIRDYWYVAVSWLLLMFIFWHWRPVLNINRLKKIKMSWIAAVMQSFILLVIAGLILLGARGTRLKPISMVDAASYAELKYIPFVLNTPFSIIKTMENENLENLDYFPQESLVSMYNPVHTPIQGHSFKKQNVVIIILESFSKEYCGFLGGEKGYTPNLDSLLARSLVFPNAFANGTQSYEAMAAIIAGIPSLMDRPYGGSSYADNIIESLPWILRQEGYHTSFFHGGNNGTMGFNNFARITGIEYYFGRNEYDNDKEYDGYWGIWDEPYLQYFAKQLEQFPEPFISAVFTLSSHHPYNVPEKYTGIFKEGKLPILKSIGYADHAFGEFFKTAKLMPWFENTLFVFTADHAAQAMESNFNSTTGMFSIPLAFYCASDSSLKGINQAIAQQIDILPTTLDYLQYEKDYFAFGASLLDSASDHRCISYVNGIYQLIEHDYVLQFDGQKVTGFFPYDGNEKDSTVGSPGNADDPEIQSYQLRMENDMKAILQTYNYCLINNQTALRIK